MLARHCPNPKHEDGAGRKLDQRKRDQQIATGDDRRRTLFLDLKRDVQQADGLAFIQLFLAALDGRDKVAALLPRATCVAQHVQLERGECNSRGDEDEHDSGRDQEQLTVEAHAYN